VRVGGASTLSVQRAALREQRAQELRDAGEYYDRNANALQALIGALTSGQREAEIAVLADRLGSIDYAAPMPAIFAMDGATAVQVAAAGGAGNAAAPMDGVTASTAVNQGSHRRVLVNLLMLCVHVHDCCVIGHYTMILPLMLRYLTVAYRPYQAAAPW